MAAAHRHISDNVDAHVSTGGGNAVNVVRLIGERTGCRVPVQSQQTEKRRVKEIRERNDPRSCSQSLREQNVDGRLDCKVVDWSMGGGSPEITGGGKN
jgi:hypothetical protein